MTTYDFGYGPVAAHQHLNGGGWVADTASVSEKAFIGPLAKVAGGTIEGGTIRGGTIWGGTIWGGTIRGGTVTRNVTFITGCLPYSVTITDNFVGIGCEWHPPSYWLNDGEEHFRREVGNEAAHLHRLLCHFIELHGCIDEEGNK